MKLLAFALWFIFWGQALELAFAQESLIPVASSSAALDAFSDGAAPHADAFADAYHPAYVGVCNTQTIDWCGAFEAQLLATGYAAIRDQTHPNLVKIVTIA